jgi:VWFA-related protein
MRATALVLGFTGFVCAALAAQQPVFRSGVQYVAVDVVVTDKGDRPVTDLRREEFEITENGRRQAIADFQFVSVPMISRTTSLRETASEPEPDVATNVAPSPESRLFVMLIDDLHLIEQNIVEIKRVLTDTLNAFSPDDEVAMVFVSHSDMSVNFTRNRAKLAAVIGNVRGALGFGLDSLAHAPSGAGTAASGNSLYASTAPSRFRGAYATAAAETLRNVARSLAGSGHSRRAIFFFSGGTTLEPWDIGSPNYSAEVADELKATFAEAARADVPIYAIDPRGNVTPDDATREGMRLVSERLRAEIRNNIRIQHNNLAEIAVNTGGRAVFGAADMKRMVEEIVQENGSYYLLGYYPEPFVADGKFHDLKVAVSRPGTIVRARKGYVAPSTGRATESTASVLDAAMSAGVNVSGLPIRVFATPVAATPKGMTTAVTVEVTYPAPIDGSRRIDDNIELSLIALDPDAKVKLKATRPMRFVGSAPGTGDITFLMDDVIELPAQALTLRVGVASQALGKAGTSQIALEIPKISDGKLHMSGVAIGLAGSPRQAVMNAALIAQLLPFQPTTSRQFTSADALRIFARFFWKGDGQPTVTVSVTGPGTLTPPVTLTPEPADAGRHQAAIDTVVPLNNLPPGTYHLTLDARLPNGQSVHRVIAFEVKL